MFDNLKELCLLNGTSGNEDAVREYIINEIKDYAEYHIDNLGNIIAFKKGKKVPHKKIMLDAHMDEVALIVTSIQSDGTLTVDTVGGVDASVVIGRQVIVGREKLVGVAGAKAIHKLSKDEREKKPEIDSLYIDFGAENADLSQLNKIADILVDEPRSYQDALNIYLKEGKNFPAARILALKSYLSAESSDAALQTEPLTSLLSTPNNILGIEYLKALKTCGSQIAPYPILREGAGYHDTDILLKNASASAIRQTLKQAGSSGSSSGSAPDFASFSAAMPQEAFRIFSEYLASSTYLEADDFSGILNYLLLFYPAEALACFADCNIEIANRLKKNRSAFSSFTQFAALNQSRDITYARMSRIFTHILLHMTAEDYKQAKQLGYVPYLRPLGFKKSSSDVLGEIKKHTDIPLIGKLANARQTLSDDAFRLLEKDIFAADLYEQVLAQKNRTIPRNEYTREIVLL